MSWLAKHLKFIDETGIHLGMTRLYGRALPGERVVDAVPSHSGQHFTLLATMGLTGVSAPWVLEGAVDGTAFEVYVRDVLGPTLVSGDSVLMDNLSAHKAPAITAVIMARDARVEFLPPYSSDWNPIEQCREFHLLDIHIGRRRAVGRFIYASSSEARQTRDRLCLCPRCCTLPNPYRSRPRTPTYGRH